MNSANTSTIFSKQQHPYHLVDASPWPLLVSFAVMQFVLSVLFYFSTSSYTLLFFSFLQLFFFKLNWFNDIVTEATFEGNHTLHVQSSIRFAMFLFIVSEIMFFFGFFWSLFHFSLVPSIWIGCVWPPVGIKVIHFSALPLLNTLLLLSSGVSVTLAHRAIISGHYMKFNYGLIVTLFFGIVFVFCQWFEYNYAQFSISDSVYGSIFYMMTGFHGLHVIVGLVFLAVCFIRFLKFHFTREHHVGLECAIWYWHFVDVVWLFLYLFVYFFGSAR